MLKFGSKNDVTVVHRATIRLLDDSEIIHCDFQPQHKGKFILEYVCKQLNIVETDYFGLRYVDQCRQRHWLDLAKTAIKQVKEMDPILFSFRVKFYPPDPLRLKEEITRYQIYQQLKRDLLHGRLCCSLGEAALLSACILHNEFGEYDPEIHVGSYISEHKLLLKQTEAIEEKAMELHQTQLKGFTAEQAETHFLKLASQLDTYAVDPHPVKDHKSTQLYLGINHHGILTFQGSRKTNHFRWSEVQKINYEGKMFIVHLTINEKKHTVGFKCPTGSNCRYVWRCAVEQMLFFTLPRASDAPTVVSGGSWGFWGTKFKYTGRTEREVLEETLASSNSEGTSLRGKSDGSDRCQSSGLRRKASSVPATPSTPSQDLIEIRYSSLPRSCHSTGLDGAGMADNGSGTNVPISSPYCPDNTLPLLETVSEDQEIYAKRNNTVDENESHASATHTTSITNQVKKMKLKSTFGRPQTLISQKIVINSDELIGNKNNIETLIRQKIQSLQKSPKVVKSTAIIIKSSKTPIKSLQLNNNNSNTKDFNNDSNIHNKSTIERTNSDDDDDDDDDKCKDQQMQVSSSKLIPHESSTKTANFNQQINSKIPNDSVFITTSTIKNRPMALAMAIAAAAVAATNNTMTCGTGNNYKKIENLDSSDVNNRRVGGQLGDLDGNDYYFRDSFDHSSSESQLIEGMVISPSTAGSTNVIGTSGKYQNKSITPTRKIQQKNPIQNTAICLQQSIGNKSVINKYRSGGGVKFVRLFVSAFVLTVTMLFIVVIIVFETDSIVFDSIRKTDEMIAIKSQYYIPIREFFRTKLGLI